MPTPLPLDRSEVLLQVANLLAAGDDLDQVLAAVAEVVRQGLAARRCNILLLGDEGTTLRPGASAAGRPDRRLFEIYKQMPAILLDRASPLRQALEGDRAIQIEDATASDLLSPEWTETFELESLLLLPLRHADRLTGMMAVEYASGTCLTPDQVETMEAVAHQAAMVVGHARAQEETRRTSAALAERVMQQSVLLDISVLLAGTMDLDQLLQRVAESLATVLPVTYCRIATWDEGRRVLEIRAGYSRRGGVEHVLIGHTIDPGRSPWHARVLETREPLAVSGMAAREEDADLRGGAQSLLLLPISGSDRLYGIVTIGEERSASRSPFSLDRIDFYRTLSSQAALAIEKADLFAARENSYWSAIHSIASVVEARDMGTHDHVYRVSAIAVELADRLGIRGDRREALQRAAILHDFGKIAVPDRILLKPGPLTSEEWVEMREHSSIGSILLGRIPFLEEAMPLVRHHHESWDGRGYPGGLAGKRIPAGSRVIAVADTFDAMTTERPYRAALPAERAFEEIMSRAGAQYDPEVAEVFAEAFADGGVGRAVSLAHVRAGLGRVAS
ncbi:MAG TPA: HD domain-containing phosphohydrolase [Candidatus Dormibacteraeota bacterium]|nr:HD domain-containing phosphohydrolase [Candidatus Dormibacteraeota bacterium]